MGPGMGLLFGIPLVVMLLALLAIWRRERIEGPTKSRVWLWFYRALTVALVLFAAYMLGGFYYFRPTRPRHDGAGR